MMTPLARSMPSDDVNVVKIRFCIRFQNKGIYKIYRSKYGFVTGCDLMKLKIAPSIKKPMMIRKRLF
jgi:hypothetical protein